MPSLEIVVSPHRLQVDAPGGCWEDFTGDPGVFKIADVFLQIFRGSITCLLNLCHVESRRFSLYIIALLQNHILSTVILSISFTVVIQRLGKLHCIDSVDCRSLFRRSTIDRICKIAWFRWALLNTGTEWNGTEYTGISRNIPEQGRMTPE